MCLEFGHVNAEITIFISK